jgi:hypothetical protein
MKGLLVLIAPLLLTMCLAANANAFISTGNGAWVWQNPLPQGNPTTAIDFVDSQNGWAVSG